MKFIQIGYSETQALTQAFYSSKRSILKIEDRYNLLSDPMAFSYKINKQNLSPYLSDKLLHVGLIKFVTMKREHFLAAMSLLPLEFRNGIVFRYPSDFTLVPYRWEDWYNSFTEPRILVE